MKNTNQQTGNNEPFDDTACEIEIEAREFLNGIEASEATPEPAERENDETPDAPEYCRNIEIENDSYYTR